MCVCAYKHIHNGFSHTHSNTSEGVRVTWERQVLKRQQHHRRWLNTKSWGEKLSGTDGMAFNFSREVTCSAVSAERAIVWSSRKPVSKMSDFEKPGRKKQTALIHFCWNIAQKRSWIDVNLSDYNKDLDNRSQQILKGGFLIITAFRFSCEKERKRHWYAIDVNATIKWKFEKWQNIKDCGQSGL